MRVLAALLCVLAVPAPAGAQDQQVGARTKAMGGSYTAFEDDPVSVWLNPAGISTQPDAMSISYQTYTIYEPFIQPPFTDFEVPSEASWSEPALIPSYLGFVFQLGHGETEHAVGICFTAPFRNKYVFSDFAVLSQLDQAFYRFRVAYARDFRIRPKGESGFLTHVSVGAGLDMSVTSWRLEGVFTEDPAEDLNSISFTDFGVGGGLGLLVGLFDNGENLKINLGVAYQSRAGYDFSISQALSATSDWPNQVNGGFTVYLLAGQPLRLTFDAQWINWDRATEDSIYDTGISALDNDFEDVFNVSIGAEYRFRPSEDVRLFVRAGLRLYDAPWDDADAPGAIGVQVLFIEPSDERFLVFSLGLGLGWQTEAGKQRMVDVAADYGADSPGFAFGFTMEF